MLDTIYYAKAPLLIGASDADVSPTEPGTLTVIDGVTVVVKPDGRVVSMQPDGSVGDRDPGTHGPWESTSRGTPNVLVYTVEGATYYLPYKGRFA